MGLRRYLQIVGCILVSGLILTAFYFADAKVQRAKLTADSLQWARQVASQAEGMSFAARQKGEADPIAWAVNFLAQGVEPRIMRITRYKTDPGLSTELYQLDFRAGIFDFTKVLTPEDGSGVRIQIRVPYVGFLGTRSHFGNDLGVAFTFLLLFGALFGLSSRWLSQGTDPKLRVRVVDWIKEAKSILGMLGDQIRAVIQESQAVSKAGEKTRECLESLRHRTHGGIQSTRKARAMLGELEHSVLLSEVLILNLLVSAEKTGVPDLVVETAEELHRVIQKLKSVNSGSARTLTELERNLEPVATDADLAVQTQQELLQAVRKVDGQIRRTTETMLAQARQIQEFSSELSVSARKR